jgi:AcrR family transcriptional regulator
MVDSGAGGQFSPPILSAAQGRIISAALELFARNGVGGTSLQMIADAVGVTKAAIYHQYNTKDEIVLAAAKAELGQLDSIVRSAESETTRLGGRQLLIVGMIDLAVAHRRTVGAILTDPLVTHSFSDNKDFRQVMDRMSRVLFGSEVGHQARVSTAMLTAAISGTVMHPLVAALDDETLRSELRHLVARFLPARIAAKRS